MAKALVRLTFPPKLIRQPVTFKMAAKFKLVPNIRRANVTPTVGEIIMEIAGKPADLDKGLAWLSRQGVKVEPVTGSALA